MRVSSTQMVRLPASAVEAAVGAAEPGAAGVVAGAPVLPQAARLRATPAASIETMLLRIDFSFDEGGSRAIPRGLKPTVAQTLASLIVLFRNDFITARDFRRPLRHY